MPSNGELERLRRTVDELKRAPMFDKAQHAEAVGRAALDALDDIYDRLKRIENDRP